MKYAVIHPRLGATHVAASYRWAWLAQLFAELYKLRNPAIEGVEIVTVTQSPQEIINICEHRDRALEACEEALSERNEAIYILAGLVSRDDVGNWTTVHQADTVVSGSCDRLLA